MPKPEPESLPPEKVRDEALRVIAEDRFPYLATIEDDQPRLRPVSPVRTVGFTVFVANLKAYGKTAEIEANPKVELCYLDKGHDQVRVTAVAKVLDCRETLESIWSENPLLRQQTACTGLHRRPCSQVLRDGLNVFDIFASCP